MNDSIDILMCTFRRPQVTEALAALMTVEPPTGYTLRIVVADNDDTPSAEAAVRQVAESARWPVTYLHAPARNISIARNACLDVATAGWVAFIDDDETAQPGWLVDLRERATATGVDAVFGPVRAIYPDGTPDWIRRLDLHSSLPVERGGEVRTGATNNALLRWAGTPWQGIRFDLARGRSGGEDTEFFFRLRRVGARYAMTRAALVSEPVDPARLGFGWLAHRRFRMGQSYITAAASPAARARLAATSVAKAAFSLGMAPFAFRKPVRWRFWILRAALHAGVVAGSLRLPERESYG